MNQSELDRLCNEILTSIEIREARLLNWGFVDVRSNLETDLPHILQDLPPLARELWIAAEQNGAIAADVLKNLQERRLIFQGQEGLYRTRFAEAVRLLYLLRQRFSHDDWQTANRLVSDMRIQLQRRRYPAYNHPLPELLDELKDQSALRVSEIHLATIARLLQKEDGSFLDLAQFQKEAILQQFRNLQAKQDRALVIGAGTGAGKTKAFYIPALAHIADLLAKNSHSVKTLTLYPRVELLKDQLAEAFSEARKLDSLLQEQGKRPITLGAYYGDTPKSAQHFFERHTPAGWEQTRDKSGWIPPFFSCPNGPNHRLIWEQGDLEQERKANKQGRYGQYARLRCRTCAFELSADQLLLTREQMIMQPPDILFTTTEMLNRRLSRAREHTLFGIDTPTPPRLVLLDEIHTYEGVTGAQVAYLLRRWRHASFHNRQNNLCIVGLSATLTQAESFFARLTGVPIHNVGYIFPRDEDLIEEGMEYNLVLKGDPVSGTSLLSTSVQSAMLLGRILDNVHHPVSRGAYGYKIFAFTDKLDVINRWYHIQYDAEKIKTLSQYREVDQAIGMEARRLRNEMGQDWQVCKLLGHELKAPLRLERTSSQDRGVSANADLVIATSTLEVGFNDPTVGAVIQHKAPRSLASFLQRKGRAGRQRQMRPWTIVVTSAYGRDRWAFQHAEILFNPLLPPIELPIENYYVRKIQAAYVLMDWLSLQLKKYKPNIDIWELLSSNKTNRSHYHQKQRKQIRRLLAEILDGSRSENFKAYLKAALGIEDEATMLSLLWGEPRPLLLEVIPTLLRQLESNWQSLKDSQSQPWQDSIANRPMPQFTPSTLFADLNPYEVILHIPERNSKNRDDQNGRNEFMGLGQALIEFAPGRVSKRFARRYAINEAHWLVLPDDAQISRNALSLRYLNIELGEQVPKQIQIGDEDYLVYQPIAYTLEPVPNNVRNTSYGQLIWKSHFEPKHQRTVIGSATSNSNKASTETLGTQLSLSPDSKWRRFFHSIEAFVQLNDAWVEVTRLGIGVEVDTRYKGGGERRRVLRFEDPTVIGQSAAIGFSLDVDALKITFETLDTQQLMAMPDWPGLYRYFGPQYFLYKLQHDIRLIETGLSRFEIEWLWQLELSMLVATAIARQTTLQEAAKEVQTKRHAFADRTLRVIFQTQQLDSDAGEEETGRLHQKLMGYLADPAVQDALRDAQIVLWQGGDGDTFLKWLENSYASSLGAVLFTAVTRLVTDIEPDDLVMDVAGNVIWISEVTSGGVGLISKIADAIARRPREFELQLLDVLQHCDREQLASNLRAIAALVEKEDPDLKQAFQQARSKTDLPSLSQTRKLLTRTLETHGIIAGRELIVALNTKFLRPNSDEDSDKLIAALARHWEQEEERLGCAIDLRVMSVAAPQIDEIKQHLQRVLRRIGGAEGAIDENQIFNLLQSLLWLDCSDGCPNCIEKWQPYQQLNRPSRALLLSLLKPSAQEVIYGEDEWTSAVKRALASKYQVQLRCVQSSLPECKKSLLNLLVTPIDIGFQSFFPIVERIERVGKAWVVHLAIRELIGY